MEVKDEQCVESNTYIDSIQEWNDKWKFCKDDKVPHVSVG